jgi:signal transduction histidine kinase
MDLDIDLELATGRISVDVDLVQIEQVLLNLVRNALDALGEVPKERRRLRISTRLDGDWAEVSVEDSGPGIPAEQMQHLFDPFFTTKQSGMGMGLPISQTILDNHEGEIRAESRPGADTVFRVRLPVAIKSACSSTGGQ